MKNLMRLLWQDEYGVILSTEIVIVGSVLVLGLITGMTCLQRAVNGELQDLASAVGALDQSYAFSSHHKPGGVAGQCCAWTAGSSFINRELQEVRCGDMVGCEGCQDTLLHQPCGNCEAADQECPECTHGHHETCERCGSACTHSAECSQTCHECTDVHECVNCGEGSSVPGCSTCGGVPGGCGSCGGADGLCGGPGGLESGVPKMKITEWPAADSSWLVPDSGLSQSPAGVPGRVAPPRSGSRFNFPDLVW